MVLNSMTGRMTTWYRWNRWDEAQKIALVEVEAGDFMWLRAFCPQACDAGGPVPFRYLLYKDVNRHAPLVPLTAATPGSG